MKKKNMEQIWAESKSTATERFDAKKKAAIINEVQEEIKCYEKLTKKVSIKDNNAFKPVVPI